MENPTLPPHDPSKFSFTKKSAGPVEGVQPDGKYFYGRRLHFAPGQDYMSVYNADTQALQAASYFDFLSSTVALGSVAKLV